MRPAFFLLVLLLGPGIASADVVYLKDAGTITGRVVEQTDEFVKVDIGDGVLGVPASRVERIEKGKTPLDEYDARASRLDADDVKGWRSLGRWARQQGLYSQTKEAFENVLANAPDDPEARDALGYVQIDGKWMTEEESYRARGFVRYEGEWMTSAEAQAAQTAFAAEEARRDAEASAREAEARAADAERRAEEAEERAREAEEDPWRTQDPLYWGSWGYGLTYWPSTPIGDGRPGNRPVQRPSGGRR